MEFIRYCLKTRSAHDRLQLLFLTPYLLGTFFLVVVPALATAVLAFTNFDGQSIPQWAGLNNFGRLAQSPLVRLSLYNTFVFAGWAVPIRIIGAMLLALLLSDQKPLFGLYRAAVYLPTVIPEVSYALIWLWIFNPIYGPLNLVLAFLGLPTPAWLTDPTTARYAFVLVSFFQLGEGFVVLLVGLQNIPKSLYEAAVVDGASSWQSFWHITLPLLMPWLLLLTFRDVLMSIQSTFTPSFVMTYGGPYYATTFIPLLVYEISFDFQDLGLGSALLLVTFFMATLLILGIIRLTGLSGEADDL